jgi:SNF2 family DNA or RNA helicase
MQSAWYSEGDKVLLFSYSVRMLNILEKMLSAEGHAYQRLDGRWDCACLLKHMS